MARAPIQPPKLPALIAGWAVASSACFGLGYLLGQPGTRPYLVEFLLIGLIVAFIVAAAAGSFIYLRRTHASDMPVKLGSLVVITVFFIAVFFVGRWIAASELHASAPPPAGAGTTTTAPGP
jgi:hypothetical protein